MALVCEGSVVKSQAGHDKGRFYVVVKVEGTCAYIADGKLRKLEKPKRKNLKHLSPTNTVISRVQVTGNNALKKMLSTFYHQA